MLLNLLWQKDVQWIKSRILFSICLVKKTPWPDSYTATPSISVRKLGVYCTIVVREVRQWCLFLYRKLVGGKCHYHHTDSEGTIPSLFGTFTLYIVFLFICLLLGHLLSGNWKIVFCYHGDTYKLNIGIDPR